MLNENAKNLLEKFKEELGLEGEFEVQESFLLSAEELELDLEPGDYLVHSGWFSGSPETVISLVVGEGGVVLHSEIC